MCIKMSQDGIDGNARGGQNHACRKATTMKCTFKTKSKRLILTAVVALAGFLPQSKASLSLGSAGTFAVLGASAVTSTGNTVLNGDLGLYPGTLITGFNTVDGGPGIVNGTIHDTDAVAQQAQADALAAYNYLAVQPHGQDLNGQDLGALTQPLTAGVYFFSSSAQLTGTLTLNGPGTFVFMIGSTLTTASSSSVLLTGGAQASDVFWQVGSSATLGTGTSFDGTILALDSITLNAGASISGRALVLNGAVTLADNAITVPTAVPEPTTMIAGALLLLPFGLRTIRPLRRNRGV